MPTRTCALTGKYCFPNRLAARRAMRVAAQRRILVIEALGGPQAGSRREIRSFKCPHCHHWHLRSGLRQGRTQLRPR